MPANHTPFVAILLLNWNGWKDTIECLQSISQSTGVAFSIVVCDNGSHDSSLEKITGWARAASRPFALYDRTQAEAGGAVGQDEPLVLIQTGANLGFAGGNNVGLRYCLAHGGFDYVWVLNNDTVVAPDALQQLVARAQQDPAIGICGSKLVFYHQRGQVQAYGGSAFDARRGVVVPIGQFAPTEAACDVAAVEAQTAYVVGASMLVSTPFLQTVGLMCEDYFLYFEEIDWAFRARGKFKLAYADASVVWHKEGGTIGSSSTKEPSATSTRYLYRNRMIFNWRYNRAHFARCLVQVGFEMLVLLKRGQFKTVKVALSSSLAGLLALRHTGVPYAG
ncbi:glycosyltransferase family 2 protein [uncultured Rhodoferax sp.]|uniref:glycosyltransferase family 2 protein n=1 Tax=uncultured Rhodoferax sp. TaxID=223188 RepID=UPI0025DDE63B|nr:glycosyltransferase family 2 protein [uncultured Rhodoferax sp.]